MIALLDGDILVYRIGYASNNEHEKINKARMKEFIVDLLLDLDVEDYEGFITEVSSDNFRHAIATTAPYKGTRNGNKPMHYDALRDYLVNSWSFHSVRGQEADDSIGQWATKLGKEAIICSIDKDLDQIPGWHYNFVKRHKYYVDETEGFRRFCLQVLTGDRVDNVVGLRNIGPVKSASLYDEFCRNGSEKEHILRQVRDYYEEHDEGGIEHFKENCRLLWIRRNSDGSPELIEKLLDTL